MEQRTCVDCVSGFIPKNKNGPKPQRCEPCREARKRLTDAAKTKRWNEADPARARASWNKYNRKRLADPAFVERRRLEHLFKKYGLTQADLAAMIAAQDGKCAICDGPPNGPGDRLHIDHCHDTGKVRALLCGKCNTLIGLADHEPERLLAAALYLERSTAN